MRIQLAVLFSLGITLAVASVAQNAGRPGALSIVEAGLAADGVTPRYTIEANGADIRDVLAALLRKTGTEYTINQDVTGPISFVLRDKTLDEILDRLQAVARPAIIIQRGEVISIATAPPESLQGAPNTPRPRIEAIRPSQALVMPGQVLPFNQRVTLSIPDDKPIPLRTALRQIESQTQVPIRLDPRVPADIGLAARFTDTPLALVLESIARTGALKWQTQLDGSILIAPTDWLLVSVRGVPAWGQPSSVCPRCNRPVLPSWSFCPHDGTPLGRQSRQSPPRSSR